MKRKGKRLKNGKEKVWPSVLRTAGVTVTQ